MLMDSPEEKARLKIDQMLEAAGWVAQSMKDLNLGANLGVAVREFPTARGEADYLLFADRKAVGVIEAKPEGNTLSGVSDQSAKYIAGFPENIPHVTLPLPFSYESTGTETQFADLRDPDYRSRSVFSFHRPETLLEWAVQTDTLRARLRQLPPLIMEGLWDAQIEAIRGLEQSLGEARPRALIQMATGSGKTYTAVNFIYRLIKFAGAKRVLFLVDRNNLGKQTLKEFQDYRTPDDGRKFTELYNVQRLTSNTIDPVNKVVITTIQRLYSMLKGEELPEDLEEQSWFELDSGADPVERTVEYNPAIPIETFDFIITDECHRSIYHLWRQVLEYFDSFIIGLTATPSKHTLGFFDQNLVTEYSHERAVADGVNVGYEVYRIRTRITQQGSTVEAGHFIDIRDKQTRKVRWEELGDDLEYAPEHLDRDVVAKDQIRTVIRAFREKLFIEIFPGRNVVPKTLVFAKDDSHAEDIVQIIRDEFGKGNEFCKKITYRTTGEKPEDLISFFRNSYNPRIAVSVDMISTGTDIKPLECLLFLRTIKSQTYFEQMKGRGTRVINPNDLMMVSPDARHKTHFVIVDAVGVCEDDKTDTRSLERKRHIPLDKLLTMVALGQRDVDTLTTLACRLARLDRQLTPKDRAEIASASGGRSLKELTNRLLDAVDPDVVACKAQAKFQTENPSQEQIDQAQAEMVKQACKPFDLAGLRNVLIDIKRRNEQVIDTISQDEILTAGFDEAAKEKAQSLVQTFQHFIQEHKDELTALQIFYNQPYGQRHLTYQAVKELAEAIAKPPYSLTTDALWRAYEQLDQSKVRHAGPQRLLTDIISLLRFALGESKILEPFPLTVEERFKNWLLEQMEAGRQFSAEQIDWLNMIKDHIAASVTMEMDDFDYEPFVQKGGAVKVYQLFGVELGDLLNMLNQNLGL